MKFLFVHNNFPAQFHRISVALAAQKENEVYFLSMYKRRKELNAPNVKWIQIQSKNRQFNKLPFHEHATIFAEAMEQVKKSGFTPDIIHGHVNFGTMNYAKDVFEKARQTGFFEWYFRDETEKEIHKENYPHELSVKIQQRQSNILALSALDLVDIGIAPTTWQKIQFPKRYHDKITTIHDGIDTEFFTPKKSNDNLQLPSQIVPLLNKTEFVTYTARALEPHRGFPSFYRAIPQILKDRPNAHIIIVGDEKHNYDKAPKKHETYLAQMQEEMKLNNIQFDLERVHIFPFLPYHAYKSILQISDAHVYLSVPFVLSWSFLEAMSCACLMIGSNTEPVQEVLEHKENGLMVDLYNPEQIAKTVCFALKNKEKLMPLREKARQTVLAKYDTKILFPKYIKALIG